MKPEQACKYQVPFGKYIDKTLEWVATCDPDGPRYLDWMAELDDLSEDFREALECFLAISWVKELVDRAIEKHTPKVRTEPIENLKTPKLWWEKKK